MSWDVSTIQGLADCPRSSLRWAALGYRAGVRDGRDDVLVEIGRAGEAVRRHGKPVLAQPAWDVLQGRRDPDYQPCAARCARCIASLAYAGRGGRPFLGVEREAEMAARGAA